MVGNEFGCAVRLRNPADALAAGEARIEDIVYVAVVHITAPVVPGRAVIGLGGGGPGVGHHRPQIGKAGVIGIDVEVAAQNHGPAFWVHLPYPFHHKRQAISARLHSDVVQMGIHKEELIDGVELGGVATFIGSGETSDISLFI